MNEQNEGLKGHCHCGATTWRFAGAPDSATACNCTVCRRYGALWAYDWLDERITTTGPTVTYIRGDKEIGFHHCATCGCVMWWQAVTPDEAGRTRTAVNLRMIDTHHAVADLPIRHFDGEGAFKDEPMDHRRLMDMWY